MCDTLVAVPPSTLANNVLFGKNADCEVNEACATIQIGRKEYFPGEVFRTTHIVIPQASETHQVLMAKSSWTYGCEMGVNEYGLAIGNEAVYTKAMKLENLDGLIGPDLIRLALERSTTCLEAISLITDLLEQYGQGGNCWLSGNEHFDSSFIIADPREAYILETAGRHWVVKRVEIFASISNMLSLTKGVDRLSFGESDYSNNWVEQFSEEKYVSRLCAQDRKAATSSILQAKSGQINIRDIFTTLRLHKTDYHPSSSDNGSVCMHAGPQENRSFQTVGALVADLRSNSIVCWVTGTSAPCISIFKPVFIGVDLPDIGPPPTERFDPQTLWWKHELLHRLAMTDFHSFVPAIREDFENLENHFIHTVDLVRNGSNTEKHDFMEYCFKSAMTATEKWISELKATHNHTKMDHQYLDMWKLYNNQAGFPEIYDHSRT